jgi:hypothetical protein
VRPAVGGQAGGRAGGRAAPSPAHRVEHLAAASLPAGDVPNDILHSLPVHRLAGLLRAVCRRRQLGGLPHTVRAVGG